MAEEKHKIEALLFAAARFLGVDDIAKHSGIKDKENILSHIRELKQEYEQHSSPLLIIEEGNMWKMSVRDEFLPLIRKVVTMTEMDKPLMETLAVIAWKYPSLQSDIIKVRHNKAYDHLRTLEEQGFITRNNYKRTRKITLTQKFFEYFDLPNRQKAQEAFKAVLPEEVKRNVEELERQIEDAEMIIDDAKKTKDKQDAEKERKEPEQHDIGLSKLDEETVDHDENVAAELPKVQAEDEVPGQ